MTAVLDDEARRTALAVDPAPAPDAPLDGPPPGDDEAAVNPVITAASGFLAAAAAGWLAGGVFSGFVPRLVGVLGAAIGTGAVALSYRTRRTALVQYAGVAAAIVTGAVLVMPDAGSGSANLPSLVVEAMRGGGIGTPPVPFLPGWRFILVVFIALLGGGASAAAIALNKPKLAVFVPLPIVFGTALLQPTSAPAALTAVAVALVPAALTVSHGARLAQEGSTTGRFEARRLLRSAAVLALMMVVLVVLSTLGLLIPKPNNDAIIPPQRPQPPPPQVDRPIFKVSSERQVPWRLGVLDVYDGKGWLLPPYDPKRLEMVPPSGAVPPGAQVPRAKPGRPTFEATFTVADIQGAVAPAVASPSSVAHGGFKLQIDPRTQTLRLPSGRVPSGTTYRVTAAVPPSGADLISAPAPSSAMAQYLKAPAPPDDVVTLLGRAPTTNLFDRLQFVRDALYGSVVAAGGGKPVDVPPARVVAMLGGAEASPFEITAAEVLLARWAGVPARLGYGFYGGDRPDPAKPELEIRPRHGATWLEAWFEGYGWVPLVGVPNKAKASKSNDQQDRPDIRPSEQVALAAYVPVRVASVRLLFEVVRYWIARIAPLTLLVLLAWWSYPGFLKVLRRAKRRAWARRHGPVGQVVFAYAELRDLANDLNIGNPVDSAIEFVDIIEPDAEHAELAWLVTRAVWGDLSRGVQPEDAEMAVEMARSVGKRLSQAQPAVTRIIAFGSRASLREPFSAEIPNVWPTWLDRHQHRLRVPSLRSVLGLLRPRTLVRAPIAVAHVPARIVARALRQPRRVVAPASVLVVLALVSALFIAGSGTKSSRVEATPSLPERTVPDRLGAFAFQREPSLESGFARAGDNALVATGQVFSIRRGDEVLGSIQLAPFRAGLIKSDKDLDDVRNGVLKRIGNGSFVPQRVGGDVVLAQRQARTTLYVWFSPDTSYFELLVAGRELQEADVLFASLLAYQRGQAPGAVASPTLLERLDPRRGGFD